MAIVESKANDLLIGENATTSTATKLTCLSESSAVISSQQETENSAFFVLLYIISKPYFDFPPIPEVFIM